MVEGRLDNQNTTFNFKNNKLISSPRDWAWGKVLQQSAVSSYTYKFF